MSRLGALRQLYAQGSKLQKNVSLAQSLNTSIKAPTSTFLQAVREISSSKNSPGHHAPTVAPNTVIDNPPRTAEDFIEAASKPRNWITYGFCKKDQELDQDMHFMTFFLGISVFITTTMVVFGYLPDFRHADWYHREAYLELARREKRGLPLVDREFIPLDRITLPTEEELEGMEVFL